MSHFVATFTEQLHCQFAVNIKTCFILTCLQSLSLQLHLGKHLHLKETIVGHGQEGQKNEQKN